MSEKTNAHLEQNEHLKPQHAGEHHRKIHEKKISTADKKHGSTENLEAIRNTVEKQTPAVKHEISHSGSESTNHHPVLVNKHLKETAFTRSLTRTRKKLSAPSKAFSKVIHVPVIDKSSEFIGRTVARPTSMLWGAMFAFIGTSGLLWVTKYYGYEYNYLLVVMLFVGGAILGTLAEFTWHSLRRSKT